MIFKEWFEHGETKMWCAASLIAYVNINYPNRIFTLEEDYNAAVKGKDVIPATKEEWEAENN